MIIGDSTLSVPPLAVSKARAPVGLLRFAPSSIKTAQPISSKRLPLGRWHSPTLPSTVRDKVDIQEGSLVWVSFEDDENPWFPGAVTNTDDNGEWFRIAFEDGSWEDEVHRSRLRNFTPVTEGDPVEGCFAEDALEDCYPGTVVRVMPGGYVSIVYDDGDFDAVVPPTRYYVPPYRYEGPFFW